MKKITDSNEKRVLAIKIKKIEDKLNITGKELARICGLSDNTIYRIEGSTKSDSAISEKSILTICEKTGVDCTWMLDRNPDSDMPVFERPGFFTAKEDETPADRVKILRTETGLSQIAFSEILETSKGNIADIETGRNRLTEQMARKIEDRFEHGGAEWLLTGNERNRHYPIGAEMIEWLKNHQEQRERIWKLMKKM